MKSSPRKVSTIVSDMLQLVGGAGETQSAFLWGGLSITINRQAEACRTKEKLTVFDMLQLVVRRKTQSAFLRGGLSSRSTDKLKHVGQRKNLQCSTCFSLSLPPGKLNLRISLGGLSITNDQPTS